MRFLFDQNISPKVLKILPESFSESTHVKYEGLINALDIHIWEFAKKNNYTIVIQDSDFNDFNSLYGFPPKVIWIRTGNVKTDIVVSILIDYKDQIENFLTDPHYGCFEIIQFKPIK